MSSSTRLHISGLTPSISAQDINSKLSSFGNVQALDGFGALDANGAQSEARVPARLTMRPSAGDPRKFAYATLEAQPTQVSKCSSARVLDVCFMRLALTLRSVSSSTCCLGSD